MNVDGTVKTEEKKSVRRGQSQIQLGLQQMKTDCPTPSHGCQTPAVSAAVGSKRVDFLTANQSRAAKKNMLASTGLIHGPIQGVKDNDPNLSTNKNVKDKHNNPNFTTQSRIKLSQTQRLELGIQTADDVKDTQYKPAKSIKRFGERSSSLYASTGAASCLGGAVTDVNPVTPSQ